jgi:hypothetical protein
LADAALRAAVSLARAGIAVGRLAEGVTALGKLCATLPSEFDAANLREAKELLTSVEHCGGCGALGDGLAATTEI